MRCIINIKNQKDIVDILNSVLEDSDLQDVETKFKRLGDFLSPIFILDDDRSMSALTDIINEWLPVALEVAQDWEDEDSIKILSQIEENKFKLIGDLRNVDKLPSAKAQASINMEIEDKQVLEYKERITSSTINRLYGSAQQPRNLMQDTLRRSVISSFLVNFKKGLIIRDATEFNQNLIDLFDDLVNNIKQYAKEMGIDYDESLHLYTSSGKYTGDFNKVQELADSLFKGKFTATYLNNLYTSRINNYKSMAALNAYNSYVILNNFDTLLNKLLGKTIAIQTSYLNVFTDVDVNKYKLLDNSYLVKTWRSSDNIDALNEMGNITKIMIEQTPILHYPSGENRYGYYLAPKEFAYVFNKLKNIPIFSETVDRIRFAANVYIPKLISDALKSDIKELTPQDKNILFSVYERFYRNQYDPIQHSSYSLTEIMNKEYNEGRSSVTNQNLLNYITGMIDKTIATNYAQYRPSDSGDLILFNAKTNDINRHKLLIESDINNSNDTADIDIRRDLLHKYSVRRKDSKLSIILPGYKTSDGSFIHLIFNNNIKNMLPAIMAVDGNRNQKVLSLKDIESMVINGDTEFQKAITEFLDDTVQQSLELQTDIVDAFKDTIGASSTISALMKLTGLACRSIMKNTLEVELADGTIKPENIADFYPVEYKDELINRKSSALKTVLSDHAYLIRELARARMLVNGELAKSNSKDLEGNSIANNGLTNLINTAKVNWIEAKHLAAYNYNVATLDSIFVQNPHLLFGTTVKKEAQSKDRTQSKAVSKFNSAELAYSSIMLDFWYGLLNTDGDMSGKFFIQPTVYSDKSRQYLIGIDGEQVLTPLWDESTNSTVGGKRILDSTSEDIRNLHFATMASMYETMRSNLLSDYNKTLLPIMEELGISELNTVQDVEMIFDHINAVYKSGNITGIYANAKSASDLYMYLASVANTDVINQIHFSGKSSIEFNQLLKHYFQMFLDDKSKNIYMAKNLREKKKFARDLIANGNKFYLCDKTGKPNQVLKAFIHGASGSSYSIWAGSNYESEWIDSDTGELIIAKLVNSDGKKVRLTKNSKMNPKDSQGMILNPFFDFYFEVDNLISSNFITTTVGGPYGHPFKISIDDGVDSVTRIEQEEAGRTLAQFKRMVIYPATMHNEVQNQLNGTIPQYNIAAIKDLSAQSFNFSGSTSDTDVQDGSGWADPFMAELENFSLNDAKAGEDKKPIAHSFNSMYLSELELKYALFDIYNERMRDSEKPDNEGLRWKNILKKMTDRPWDIPVDLTVDFGGKPINISESIANPYYRVGKSFFKILNIEKVGDNLYNITQVQVNKNGIEIGTPHLKNDGPTLIDTNYKLWEAFGGEWSCSLVALRKGEDSKMNLVESDSSIKTVAWYMNNIGIIRSKQNGLLYNTDFKQELYTEGEQVEELRDMNDILNADGSFKDFANLTQKEIYQPLKHSDIHYLVNTSAAKCGATNINPKSAWFDDTPLRTFKMFTRHLGIQMDADHEADNAELTEMSQVISSLEANGYTHAIAKEAYTDLGAIVYATMKKEIDAVTEYYNLGTSTKIYDIVGKAFLKSFGDSSSKGSLAEAIVYNMKKGLGDRLNISEADIKLPFSDNNILSALIANVTSNINRTAIKRKYHGIASVLVPSHGAFQIYNLKTPKGNSVDYTYSQAVKAGIDFAQQFTNEPITTTNNILFGESYVIVNEEGQPIDVAGNVIPDALATNLTHPSVQRVTIDTIEKYWAYRNGEIKNIKRNPFKGRDLLPSRTLFKIGGQQFSVFDTDAIKTRFKVESVLNKKGILAMIKKGDFESAIKAVKTLPAPTVEIADKLQKLTDKLINQDTWRINNLIDDIKNLYRDDVINMFKRLDSEGVVKINGKDFTIDAGSLEIKEAELILPKIYATKFNLRKGDSLNDIIENEFFFYNRIKDDWQTRTKKYDIALKKSNGNHTYILLKTENNKKFLKNLTSVPVETICDDGENVVRGDFNGNIIGPFNDAELFVDNRGNEIIYTNNVEQFLEKQYNDYDDVVINPVLDEANTQYAFDILTSIKSSLTKPYTKIAQVLEANKDTTLKLQLEAKESDLEQRLKKMAREKRTSFMKSLEFIAARIPAQSMQSFMPMKVTAFSESDKNIAYVSHWQIWLQGSDFDIDKVYLMGSEFSESGKYIGWSPYFNLFTNETRKASELLPMPSGKEYTMDESNEPSVDAVNITDLVSQLNTLAASQYGNYTPEFIQTLGQLFRTLRDSKFTKFWVDKSVMDDKSWFNQDNIVRRINKHSLYLSKIKSPDMIVSMMKNSVSSKIYRIINDPANMVSAYSPIEMNEPQEAADNSESGREAKEYVLGNPFVKYNMQYQNMTGKDVIGIAAVGEKVFFAWSYYFNEAARSGDIEWQRNAFFKRTFNLIKSRDGKRYLPITRNIITNVNFDNVDKNSLIWPYLIQTQNVTPGYQKYSEEEIAYIHDTLLKQLGSEKDASLVISALLSAATDNAKELILAKINSGSDLASVYLYAIMLGIDFRDIANLMTSRTVQIIAKLNKSNIFNEYNQNSIIDNVFSKLKNGLEIKSYLNTFVGLNEAIKSVYPSAEGLKIQDALNKIFKDSDNLSIIRKLKTAFKSTDIYKNNGYPKYNLMRFINDFEELAELSNEIFHDDVHKAEFETFTKLYKLAEEIKLFGGILSANQGLQTNMFDKFGYLDKIEQLVSKRVGLYMTGEGENVGLDINKIMDDKPYLNSELMYKDPANPDKYTNARDYVTDIVSQATSEGMLDDFNSLKFLNDENYRNLAIKFYNLIKGTANVLDIISRVPHFRATIDMAATDFGIFDALSPKFTHTYNLSKYLSKDIYNVTSSKDKDTLYRNVGNFLDSVIITKWFKDRNKTFTIAAGDSYFDKHAVRHPATDTEVIRLDTCEGQATFKYWFEHTVVPNLKRGLEEKNGDRKLSLARNKFISSLHLTITDRTFTRDISYLWALPINMSSIESVTDTNNFVEYLMNFDELSKYTFNGTPVSDLFFYYNLIVNKNRYGQTSLVRLFENFVGEETGSIVQDYFKYIGEMDFNKLLSSSDYSRDDLIFACAMPLNASNKFKNYPYGKQFNPSTQTYDIVKYTGMPTFSESEYEDGYYDIDPQYGGTVSAYTPVYIPNQKEVMNYFTWLSFNYSSEQDSEVLENRLLKLINQNRAIVKYECK